jgi:hypothetical protein
LKASARDGAERAGALADFLLGQPYEASFVERVCEFLVAFVPAASGRAALGRASALAEKVAAVQMVAPSQFAAIVSCSF